MLVQKISNRAALLCLMLAGFFLYVGPVRTVAAPSVSDHIQFILAGGDPLADFFNFPMPEPCDPSPCAERRVMMAKFVVNEPTDDLSFELRSTTSPLAKYNVTAFTTAGGGANASVQDSDEGVEAATVRARFVGDAVAAGYRVVTILVRFNNNYDSFPDGEIWKIQVNSTATTDAYFGFRVDSVLESAAEPLITKPYPIEYISPAQITTGPYTSLPSSYAIDFGDVHINLDDEYRPKEAWEFLNIGTAPLEITAVNPFPLPAGPFIIDSYPAAPTNILPMNPFQRTVECHPTSLGAIADPGITLTTNAGNYSLDLSGARGIELRSAMVVDLSGSMEDDKNGQSTDVEEEEKIYLARIAALELAELYNGILPTAKMGLYSYPATGEAYACPSSEQHINMSVMETNIQGYRNHLNVNLGHGDLIDAGNYATPLAEGIKRAWDVLYPVAENSRAAVFLFGDGQQHPDCLSDAPRRDPDDWYNWSTFQNGDVPFYTIPYGATGEGWMTTYENIASNSGGETFPADITDEAELQTQFKKALGEVLDLETLKDPSGHINAGENKTHEICVSSSAYQLVFSVHWTEKDNNAVNVEIETPFGIKLTPATVSGHGKHVSYISGETFKDYIVRGKFLEGEDGIGAWKIHLRGNQSTDYVYQIYAMDRMKTEPKFTWDFIGEAGFFELALAKGNYGMANANLVAQISQPTNSYNNYLANTSISPEDLARIPDDLLLEMGPAQKKQYVLNHFLKQPFDPKTKVIKKEFGNMNENQAKLLHEYKQSSLRGEMSHAKNMRSSATAGLAGLIAETSKQEIKSSYRLPLEAALADGLHNILVSVIGLNDKAECFEREFSFATMVDIKLNAELLGKAVQWEAAAAKPFFPASLVEMINEPVPEGMLSKLVTFTPEDAQGNKFGMGRAEEITLSYTNLKTMGPLADNYDGSYSQLVQFSKDANPSVAVSIGNIESQPVSLKGGMGSDVNVVLPTWVWIIIVIVVLIIALARFMKKKKK